MSYEDLCKQLDEAEQQLGEIRAEHLSETAAFGDSWPGAQIQIARMSTYVAELREVVGRHPQHPKTVADMPARYIDTTDIPF